MTFEIRDLTFCANKRPLIENISLKFEPGILYGILGPNGSGKSTLLKTISRVWRPTRGSLHWKGENLSQFSRIEMSRTISLVPQTPQLYFDFTVYQLAAMGRYPHGRHLEGTEKVIEEALRQADAWHLRHQPISELSGGEIQRVYIARALATHAPILLMDEPTSHLDLRHQLEIWQLLRTLTKEGKLVIAAVHDLAAARRFCDRLVILNQGRCQHTGTYAEVMTASVLDEVFGVAQNRGSGIFELNA